MDGGKETLKAAYGSLLLCAWWWVSVCVFSQRNRNQSRGHSGGGAGRPPRAPHGGNGTMSSGAGGGHGVHFFSGSLPKNTHVRQSHTRK